MNPRRRRRKNLATRERRGARQAQSFSAIRWLSFDAGALEHAAQRTGPAAAVARLLVRWWQASLGESGLGDANTPLRDKVARELTFLPRTLALYEQVTGLGEQRRLAELTKIKITGTKLAALGWLLRCPGIPWAPQPPSPALTSTRRARPPAWVRRVLAKDSPA